MSARDGNSETHNAADTPTHTSTNRLYDDADTVKGEDVTFGATYPSEVYPVVRKLADVIMSILPRVADHLGRERGSEQLTISGDRHLPMLRW
jgi:hypothetical protein